MTLWRNASGRRSTPSAGPDRFTTVAEAGRAVRAKRLELFTHNDADRATG